MSIEVHVRIRPGVCNPVWASAETVLYSTANPNTRYVYNKIHPDSSSNQTIFQGIEAIVHAAFDGKNVTVMAYGQTGSGKTYSMTGSESDAGVVPRTARLLLELRRLHPGTVLRAAYTEIYNESVKDLLEPQRGELALHDAPDGGVTYEKRVADVGSYADFCELQSAAERNRKYGVTNLNDHSSRSHIILTFEIHRPNRPGKSLINLVDLAGSESAARANTEGMSLREGGFINRSLLTLGNVVDAIVERRPYVPYRDAKLTRILRTCLGGSGITLILCCVNPSRENYEQTIATLRFTQRAMKIKNDPVVVLTMPPLFTHQYSESSRQLVEGLRESTEAEYQRGLRDAYMYCTGTAASVVSNFESQVADSLHALASAQRLLIAHDHAAGMDRVGRLYNQLNDLTRQRLKNQELVECEQKRLREIDAELDRRKQKLARLGEELSTREAAADMELADWEYQLHDARKKRVRELDLLLLDEETRRARIAYEWVVCVERIASRAVPAFVNLVSTSCAAVTAASAGSDGATLADEDGARGDAAAGPVQGKAAALEELRRKLTRARAELADLECAHEMVREDIALAHSEQTGSSDAAAAQTMAAMAPFAGASAAEITERIEQLEREERALHAQAKRAVRRESLRRVRESLRRSSVSPQPAPARSPSANAKPSSRHADPIGDGARVAEPKTRARRTRSRSSGSSSRDVYADGVRNALSVLDGLKSRLLQRHGDARGSSTPRSASASGEREPTLLELYGANKENFFGYESRPGQSRKYRARRGLAPSHGVEMVADDDAAFEQPSGLQTSPADATPPVVGIAARRRWDRQHRSRSNSSNAGAERALYSLQPNSPSLPSDRRSRSRREY